MNRRLALAVFAIAVALLVATHGFAADHGDGGGLGLGANYFPPTSVDASLLGYRAVFAYTDNESPSRDGLCHVSAQFFDASGGLINEGSFQLRFGESRKLDLEPVDNNENNGQKLVRLVVTHEPLGCASATSEVTTLVRGPDGGVKNSITSWIVAPGSIVPVRGAAAAGR